MSNINSSKYEYEQLKPSDIPREYYGFSFYVSKERMVTYWHQVNEILPQKPDRLLEVGIGNGIVSAILKVYGIKVTTADINESLAPDVVVSITELDSSFKQGEFPLVLCSRVLQHLPYDKFETAIKQLYYVTNNYILLTLPVETLRVYVSFRVTGKRSSTISIPLPLFLKRIISKVIKLDQKSETQNFWKINHARHTSMNNILGILEKYFKIEKAYQVPEDKSHAFFVLKKL